MIQFTSIALDTIKCISKHIIFIGAELHLMHLQAQLDHVSSCQIPDRLMAIISNLVLYK